MQRVFSRILALRILALALLASPLLLAALLHAQRNKDPLNEQESDQIADARDQPNERVKLYQKYIQQRIDAIKTLGPNPSGEDRKAELRAKYEEVTRLCDELQDNLDTFDEARADIRKALKDLVPAAAKWPEVLNQAAPDRAYDFARKTALDAAQSTLDEAQKIYESQKKYFAEHKDEAGKNGKGPD
jgi:chromosome segregation ATPase